MQKLNIKKFRFGLAALACAAILLIAALALCACNKQKNPLDSTPCYEITMELEGEKITASQEVLYVAPANLNEMVLHLYANAFALYNDSIDILSVQINRKNVDFEIYGKDKTLMKIPCQAQAGHTVSLEINYIVKLTNGGERLGLNANGVTNLACFYPVVARYDGGWREDEYCKTGDPFFHDSSSFFVSFTLDKKSEVACSGKITQTRESQDGAKKTLEIEAENIRDFAMAVGKLRSISGAASVGKREVAINYCYFEDPFPDKTLEHIKSVLTTFSNLFGEYPYDSFTVAQSNLKGAGGMEYGSFVTVSRTPSRDEYLDVITHETAHQWWYNVVGNDQINSAWLDEGLTEFSAYYYYFVNGERPEYSKRISAASRAYSAFASHESAGFNGNMNRPLSSYLTDGEYVAVVYYKGAMLFDALRTLVGDAKFQAALRKYYEDNKFKVATEENLISAFKAQGCDVRGIVNGFIKNTAVV